MAHSWTDDRSGEEYLSTHVGFNTTNESGEWVHLGGSWKNYDSEGALRDQGSNIRSTETVDSVFLAGVPSELVDTLDDYSEVVVEIGSNTWKDQGVDRTSTFTRYFTDDDRDQEFLGGTETQDGVTRTVDGNWNQLGQPTHTSIKRDMGVQRLTERFQ